MPTIRKVIIVARSETSRLQKLITQLQDVLSGVTVQSILHDAGAEDSADPEELRHAVAQADIICTMTSSTIPLFTTPVQEPCALVLIGSYKPHMQEITQEVLAQARTNGRAVIVDSAEACLREAGELIMAGLTKTDVKELGQVLHGADVGGQSEKGVYLFKSVRERASRSSSKRHANDTWQVGISIQDIAIADVVLRLARERGVGTVVPGYD